MHDDIHTRSLLSTLDSEVTPQLSPMELRLRAMQGTPADRSEFARQVSIEVDGYRRANRFLDAMIERARRSSCPGGLWILGEGGQGKTFILDSFIRRHPHSETTERRICEVLHLTFRSRPSESEILLTILLMLGQSPRTLHYQKNAELQQIVVEAILHCGVRIILFDEAHHLWISGTSRSRRSESRWGGVLGDFLKNLYDRSGVAFVFAGMPELAELIERDKQAGSRWAGKLCLEPFQNDIQFRGVLAALDEALPMEERANLTDPKLCNLIFEASGGNFRRLKNFLAEAVFLAASDHAKSIQKRHLAQAFFLSYCNESTPFGEAKCNID